MAFDFAILITYWPLLMQGAWLTIRVCTWAFVFGYAIGVALALLSLVPSLVTRVAVKVYVAVLRAVPFIVILFVIYYGLPFAGVRLPSLAVGTIALSLYASAYYAEIVRAAIIGLPKGQFESARVVGMSPLQAMRHVIFPQLFRGLVAPSANMTVIMLKESAVLSSISIGELTYQSLVVQGRTFAPFEAFAAVALLYWMISFLIGRCGSYVERRTGHAERDNVSRSGLAASFLSFERRNAA
jgi:polar amino acid transport system permease protein